MKCPHCGKELSGVSCPECGEVSPEGANFCLACGSSIRSVSEQVDDVDDVDDVDFENRVLCSDGTCTGIIVQGKCSECGKAFKGGKKGKK